MNIDSKFWRDPTPALNNTTTETNFLAAAVAPLLKI